MRRKAQTEGCGALSRQYPSGLAQAPPGGRERPPYNTGHTGGKTGNSRHGGWMTVVEHRPSAQGPMISSARQQAWRKAGVYALPPTRGRNVGRAFSPAAWGLRHRRVCGTMRASSPADAGQGPAGVCGIPVAQGGNAPLRLRLAAHPPSGLRCPHRTARAEARLCSATAAPAPSRFLRRRRRSTPQPLAGEALGDCRPINPPL